MQSLMEWLFASLLNAEYFGKSHLIWYDSDKPDKSLERGNISIPVIASCSSEEK
jgi:hypothetical protein